MQRTTITYLSVLTFGIATLYAAMFLSPHAKMPERVTLHEGNNHRDNNPPSQMQSDYNCGPIALKMILDNYNIPSTLNEIENKMELKKSGTSMLSLKQYAEDKGLHADGWRLTLMDLVKATFPVILFVNGNHYVVADSVFQDTIFLRDPTLGRYKIPTSSLSRIWKGETLVFSHRN